MDACLFTLFQNLIGDDSKAAKEHKEQGQENGKSVKRLLWLYFSLRLLKYFLKIFICTLLCLKIEFPVLLGSQSHMLFEHLAEGLGIRVADFCPDILDLFPWCDQILFCNLNSVLAR